MWIFLNQDDWGIYSVNELEDYAKECFPDIPGWTFYIAEVSQGAFEVIGKDDLGYSVRTLKPDEGKALEECKKMARNFDYLGSKPA